VAHFCHLPALLPHDAAVVLSTVTALVDKEYRQDAAGALLTAVCAVDSKLLAENVSAIPGAQSAVKSSICIILSTDTKTHARCALCLPALRSIGMRRVRSPCNTFMQAFILRTADADVLT
jgi:hypothetical protein